MNGAQQLAGAVVFVSAVLVIAFASLGRTRLALVVWAVMLAYLVTAP